MSQPVSVESSEEYVVVAEDSPPNRTILVLLLKKLGFKVFECEDGEVAWTIMEKNRDKNIVAVISDIMMPNIDGMGLLRRTRDDNTYSSIPFVFVTAVSEKDYIFEAKNLKANGYILKPVTYQRVAQKMKEIFPNKKLPSLAG
jgi:two-component system, chemotaxis family, chemotaxis protein CheY